MEVTTYLQFLLALVFVLGLIGAVAWAARRLGLGGGVAKAGSRGRRLGIVEVAPLDGRRKLVLLRRDHVEHLVILGPNQELLVERGIAAPDGDGGDGRGESFAASLERETRT